MNDWEEIVREAPKVTRRAADVFGVSKKWLAKNAGHLPFGVNAYWFRLIRSPRDPIGLQSIPDDRELSVAPGEKADPLQEEAHRKAPLIIHRYPDRVLFLVSNTCPVYCRFCTRRRTVGRKPFPTQKQIQDSLAYLQNQPGIREVILSGGDPLMLSDKKLVHLLASLREINHIRVIRIGTRAPVTLPQRVTPELISALKPFHPIFILTQFNHPAEVTAESRQACTRFVEAGFPVLNQSVLLRGVNDSEEVLLELVEQLVAIRVIPYYLHQLDPVAGTRHFEVSEERGKQLIRYLREHTGGLAVPTYVRDDPEAPSKVPLFP